VVFGDRNDFAIEAVSDPLPGHSCGTVWGNMRIWCCRTPLGNFEERNSGLSGAQRSLSEVAEDLDSLESPDLRRLDDEAAWRFLNRLLFVEDSRSHEEVRRDAAEWSRFIFLTNWGEPFDGYNGFVFRSGVDRLRIVVREPDDHLVGFDVSTAGFGAAVQAFSRWCDEIAG